MGSISFLSGQTPHNAEIGRFVAVLLDVKGRAKGIMNLDVHESLFDTALSGAIAAQIFTILANIINTDFPLIERASTIF